jgi:hypothetical protein
LWGQALACRGLQPDCSTTPVPAPSPRDRPSHCPAPASSRSAT